jgi:hypothetical protein
MFDTSYPYGHGSGTIETNAQALSSRAALGPSRNGQTTVDANPYPHGRWTPATRSSAFAPEVNLLLNDNLACGPAH